MYANDNATVKSKYIEDIIFVIEQIFKTNKHEND